MQLFLIYSPIIISLANNVTLSSGGGDTAGLFPPSSSLRSISEELSSFLPHLEETVRWVSCERKSGVLRKEARPLFQAAETMKARKYCACVD